MNVIFGRKLNQLKECSVRAVDTGELVLKHQAISGHSAEYAPISFPFFMLFTKFQIKYNANWWCITWPYPDIWIYPIWSYTRCIKYYQLVDRSKIVLDTI